MCSEYNIKSFTHNFSPLPHKKFTLLNINCQSLRNKFDAFSCLINNLEISFDVICVTETWFYDDELQFFQLNGYNFTGTQRDTRGGGAGAFVRCGLGVGVLAAEIDGADVHSLYLTVDGLTDEKGLGITVIYRQPSSDMSTFLKSLERFLSSSNSPHLIAGDLNIDIFNEQTGEKYLTLLSIYNFTNLINTSTHYSKPHNKWSCIDHILTNFSPPDVISGTIVSDFSDHFPTFSFFDHYNLSKDSTKCTEMSSINYKTLTQDLQSVDWNLILNHSDIDTAYDEFLATLTNKVSEHTNKFKKSASTLKKDNWKPWITFELKRKIRKKEFLYHKLSKCPLDRKLELKYKSLRNEVSNSLRNNKADYFEKAFNNCRNSSDIWSLINQEILNKKENTSHKSIKIKSQADPSKIFNNSDDIANELNCYFSNIANELALKLPKPQHPLASYAKQAHESLNKDFSFKVVDENEVLTTINSLNEKKAAGLDGLSCKTMKKLVKVLSYPLTIIINRSIKENVVPKSMKAAKIKPLHKSGNRTDCCNYRPISILPIFSKILEKIANNQILNYIENQGLLNACQFGFRRGKGTSQALAVFIENAFTAFNDGKCIIGVFIDFSKAFDTIDHEILLEKLKLFNFNKSAINWIKSFLSSRTQQTQIESVLSQPKIISCGVPQGSILGPTLFLIYINDLCNVLTTLTPILYADDTSLFVESRDLNSLTSSINIDLKNLFNWCLHNKLTINLKKTAYIILKNPQNKYQFANNSIFIDKTAIDQVFTIKFLGVFIDTHLNWSHHISKLIESMRPIAGLFFRLSNHIPRKVLNYSLIHLKISYCIAPKTHTLSGLITSLVNSLVSLINFFNASICKVAFTKTGLVLDLMKIFQFCFLLLIGNIFIFAFHKIDSKYQ